MVSMLIRIRHISHYFTADPDEGIYDDQKKNPVGVFVFAYQKFINIFFYASMKDVQASKPDKKKASSPQKRTSSTSKQYISSHFFPIFFAQLGLDPDPQHGLVQYNAFVVNPSHHSRRAWRAGSVFWRARAVSLSE
jgi:hypothetical protein